MPDRPIAGRRATLAVVASAAGVSMPTVSKVVNGRADVAAATRARVEIALREHGYVPPSARRAQLGGAVELVFDGLASPYSLGVLRGVTEAAAELDVDVVIARLDERVSKGSDDWVRRLTAAGRAGTIVVTSELTAAQIAALNQARVQLVVIDPVNLPRTDVTSVGATNWSGGLAATTHLTGLGHRRIGFVGGPVNASCSQARLHGYRAALDNAGIEPDDSLVSHTTFSYEGGLELGAVMLDRPDRPTAIFAACDSSAMGVMEAARQRGLRIPEDLSVVGFDDTFMAELSTPPLTTVRQPLEDMGRVALRTLLRLAAGEALDSHHVELATHLIVRGSTAERR